MGGEIVDFYAKGETLFSINHTLKRKNMASFLDIYNRLQKLPLGGSLFNKGIGFVAPFFGKIHPNVVKLEPSLCVVQIKDRWGIRNHMGSINAGAMCTLAELTGGMALDATLSSNLRWIPKGMSVRYLARAKGRLEAVCAFDASLLKEGDVVLPISVKNLKNREVFSAEITFYISQKK